MNPKQAFENRTARLLAEGAHKPRVAYTSEAPAQVTTVGVNPFLPAPSKMDFLRRAESLACGEEFCHICGRCTDHFGEHTVEQILAWAKKPGMLQSLLEG